MPQNLKLCKELLQEKKKTLGLTVKGLSVGRMFSMRSSAEGLDLPEAEIAKLHHTLVICSLFSLTYFFF